MLMKPKSKQRKNDVVLRQLETILELERAAERKKNKGGSVFFSSKTYDTENNID
jgi:hypothetical protein